MSAPIDPTAIAPPDPDRAPLRNNVFAATRTSNTTLMPMFPQYLGRGCIVPALSSYRGGTGRDYFGQFQHMNTVDEVNICFGARGSRRRAGQVSVGPREHAVGGPFVAPTDPESFHISSITQRQSEAGRQYERVSLLCTNCQHKLADHQFEEDFKAESTNGPPGWELYLGTNLESPRAVDVQHANLHCPNCGHDNRPFPSELWGWHRYVEKFHIARDGWQVFAAAATEGAEEG